MVILIVVSILYSQIHGIPITQVNWILILVIIKQYLLLARKINVVMKNSNLLVDLTQITIKMFFKSS